MVIALLKVQKTSKEMMDGGNESRTEVRTLKFWIKMHLFNNSRCFTTEIVLQLNKP